MSLILEGSKGYLIVRNLKQHRYYIWIVQMAIKHRKEDPTLKRKTAQIVLNLPLALSQVDTTSTPEEVALYTNQRPLSRSSQNDAGEVSAYWEHKSAISIHSWYEAHMVSKRFGLPSSNQQWLINEYLKDNSLFDYKRYSLWYGCNSSILWYIHSPCYRMAHSNHPGPKERIDSRHWGVAQLKIKT